MLQFLFQPFIYPGSLEKKFSELEWGLFQHWPASNTFRAAARNFRPNTREVNSASLHLFLLLSGQRPHLECTLKNRYTDQYLTDINIISS